LKVLHLQKLTGVSGSEGHLLALLPALRARGVDACFLGLDVPGTDAPLFHEALDELGVQHASVRCGPDVSPRMARDVVRAVRMENPDLVHTHLVHADVYGALAARRLHVPYVSTRHNDDRYLLGPFRYVDRAFARGARRLIAISDAVRRFLEAAGHDPGKLVTIRYGLDNLPFEPSIPTPVAAGIPPEAPLALAIGRLIDQKDHATLLRAFARVRESLPEARLAILGAGPLEATTRAYAAELGLADAVTLPGRTEPRDWLARANVFVHTSRWEGFGIVLLEAMLASLPVVATRVSAVPEVVADGETGLLAEAGDAEAIAAALDALLADPGRARALGEAGHRRARAEFSVATMTERTLAVYDEAITSAPSSGAGVPPRS
jgi:glycosyltransferase involved in cell wall biosynthesis